MSEIRLRTQRFYGKHGFLEKGRGSIGGIPSIYYERSETGGTGGA